MMRKISLLFAIVYFCVSVSPLFAEVNIELLEQKYPRCENENFRHDCFDVNLFSNAKEEGYFRNNALWDGQYFQDDILVFEFIDGERIGKSFCIDAGDGWKVCPGGNRFKPIDGGYFDENNARQGKFIFEFENGNKFVGEFKDNLENGQGTFTWADGDKYEGEHKDGMQNGQGTYTYADGSKYVGEWKNNAKHGWGTYTSSGGSKYVGEYKEGERHGQGTSTWADGVKEVGEYRNGKLNGYAIRYGADGNILKEGIWKDDEFLYAEKRSENTNLSSGNSKLDKHKEFCEEIGFTPGTEKFAECVMVLIDTD